MLAAARVRLRASVDAHGDPPDSTQLRARTEAHLAAAVYKQEPSLWQSPEECLTALQAGIVS